MNQTDQLLTWLNDAYSMEVALEKVIENHMKDADDIPDLQNRLGQHLVETRQHAQRLKVLIESSGRKVSKTRSWLADIFGRMNAVSTSMYKDELVKNNLADYAAEQFEVACYRSLIAAAEELQLYDVAEVCRKNLTEDQAMATWLDAQIPEVTRYYLERELVATAM